LVVKIKKLTNLIKLFPQAKIETRKSINTGRLEIFLIFYLFFIVLLLLFFLKNRTQHTRVRKTFLYTYMCTARKAAASEHRNPAISNPRCYRYTNFVFNLLSFIYFN